MTTKRKQNARTYVLGHWERMQLDRALLNQVDTLRAEGWTDTAEYVANLQHILQSEGRMTITVEDDEE